MCSSNHISHTPLTHLFNEISATKQIFAILLSTAYITYLKKTLLSLKSLLKGTSHSPTIFILSLYLSLLGKLMMSFHALLLLVHPLTERKPTKQESWWVCKWQKKKKLVKKEEKWKQSDRCHLVMSCIQTSRVTAAVVTAWVRGWHQRYELSDRLWKGLVPHSHCSPLNAVIQLTTGPTIC